VREIKIPSFDSRAVFVGKTGCGKTTLAERICAQFKHVCVLDSKGELRWKDYSICTNLNDVFQSTGKIIWQPNPHEQNAETYERYFKWIYDRKNTVSYIDEVFAICKNSQDIPFWFKAILTRGRSRGVASFNATQEPVYIPRSILAQAEHYYVFQMRLEADREKIERITGIDRKDLNSLRNHEFYYADDNSFFPKKLKLRL
jgi:hypothetical protein